MLNTFVVLGVFKAIEIRLMPNMWIILDVEIGRTKDEEERPVMRRIGIELPEDINPELYPSLKKDMLVGVKGKIMTDENDGIRLVAENITIIGSN